MSLFGIAWRSIRQRSLPSLLTSLSMALGVMLVVAVLSIHGVVSQSFRSNASLGYNLIVGAKGGSLQLTLNTVYYLSQPVENIPYEYYLEYLTADLRMLDKAEPGDIDLSRDGKFGPYVSLAIPLCLGDYVGPYRLVGTTPALFNDLTFGPLGDRKYEFAQGRNFQHESDEYGYFEAVLGAVAARKLELQLGDVVHPAHGDPEGHSHAQGFTVVGILKQSGTPNDRAVFVNMEGFYLMADHAKPLEEEDGEGEGTEAVESHPVSMGTDAATTTEIPTEAAHEHGSVKREPLPMNQREVTAILVRTINPVVTPGIRNMINEGRDAQAALPVLEIFNLFEVIVRPIQAVLLVLTAMICVVSGISILVSIYNSMSERRQEIAIMRALGAGRDTVMSIILLESIFLSLGGGLAGWFLAHGLNWLASPLIEAQTGVSIHFLDIQLAEALLIPGLIVLAIICGFLPALSAYRTDVAKWL